MEIDSFLSLVRYTRIFTDVVFEKNWQSTFKLLSLYLQCMFYDRHELDDLFKKQKESSTQWFSKSYFCPLSHAKNNACVIALHTFVILKKR